MRVRRVRDSMVKQWVRSISGIGYPITGGGVRVADMNYTERARGTERRVSREVTGLSESLRSVWRPPGPYSMYQTRWLERADAVD